jgi:sphingomyelin synthase-related protein 1
MDKLNQTLNENVSCPSTVVEILHVLSINYVLFIFCFLMFRLISMKNYTQMSVQSWTSEDVEYWLRSLNLSTLIDRFCHVNGIDGLTLLLMCEDDLKQVFAGRERLCDTKKLWYHIRRLQCQQNTVNSSTTEIVHANDDVTSIGHVNNENLQCLQSTFNIDTTIFKTFKGEKRRTFASFIYALISGIWTSFIMVVVHNRVPNVKK